MNLRWLKSKKHGGEWILQSCGDEGLENWVDVPQVEASDRCKHHDGYLSQVHFDDGTGWKRCKYCPECGEELKKGNNK